MELGTNYTVWCTTECNLNCSYCYESSAEQKGKGSTSASLESDMIDFLSQRIDTISHVVLHGGEPLLNISFIRTLTERLIALNPNIKFSITTNGTLLTPEIASYFARFSKYCNLTISIDGSQHIHDKNRVDKNGRGTFSTVVENLRMFREMYPDIRVRATVNPDTVSFYAETVLTIAGYGITNIVPAINFHSNEWDAQHFEILKQQVHSLSPLIGKNSQVELSILTEIANSRVLSHCNLSPNLYVDGKIYPCIYAAGNEDDIIGDVVNGFYNDRIETLQAICKEKNVFCRQCTNVKYCIHNRCKFLNKSITSEFNVPSSAGCLYEHTKISLARELSY